MTKRLALLLGLSLILLSATPLQAQTIQYPSRTTLPFLTITTGQLRVPDGTAGAPSISFTNDTNTGVYSIVADGVGFSAGGIGLARFVNGSTWSADISGIGLRLDEGGGANAILSMRAKDASTIRYDGEQIEIVLGTNNVANVAIVPRQSGATTGASYEVRNAADTDGIRVEYLTNTRPLISVTGSLVADRTLTVRPKNATSVPWTVQGTTSQSANLQEWTDVNDVVRASIAAAGPAITAGSGTGVTVNQTAALSTAVYKVTVAYTNCIAAAVTCDLTVATLPATTFVRRVFADLTTTYACAATCTTATLSGTLGTAAGGTQFLASLDLDAAAAQFGDADAELGSLLTAAARTANGALIDGVLASWSATTTVVYRITSGTGNLGTGAATNLSQGSITFYLVTDVLP